MASALRYRGRRLLAGLALAFGVSLAASPAALAHDDGSEPHEGLLHKYKAGRLAVRMPGAGTLGYGPPGIHPGFQGFGLGYHPGYGYGGNALGVGAEGGYPFYGGPGYPHPWPCLRRWCGINPFPYYGGPGFPTPEFPNFYGQVGPLVGDQPVITIAGETQDLSGYGAFTGVMPYSEAFLAPFTTSAAATGSYRQHSMGGPETPGTGPEAPGASPETPSTSPSTSPEAPSPSPGSLPMTPSPGASRSLGVGADSVVDRNGTRGLNITRVVPGSAAEKAGLQPGDVIHSINGYRTEQLGHLNWITAHAAPENVLMMSVLSAAQGKEQSVKAVLR